MKINEHAIKVRVCISANSNGFYPVIWNANTGKVVAELDPLVDGYDPHNLNHVRRQAGIWIKNFNRARTT